MWVELNEVKRLTEKDLSYIFEKQTEEFKFKEVITKRVDSIIEPTDILCFGLDPRFDFFETMDRNSRHSFDKQLESYIREDLKMSEAKAHEIMIQWNGFLFRKGQFENNPVYGDYDLDTNPIEYWNYY